MSSHSLSQSGQSGPSTKSGPHSIGDHCCNIASRDGSFSSVAISSRIEITTSPSDSLYCVYCLVSTSLRRRSVFEVCVMLLLIYSGNCCCSIIFNSAVEANQDFSLLVDYLKCIFRPSEPLVISQTDLHYGVDSFLRGFPKYSETGIRFVINFSRSGLIG